MENSSVKLAKVNGNIEDPLRLSKTWHVESLVITPITTNTGPCHNQSINQLPLNQKGSQISLLIISLHAQLAPCNQPRQSAPDSRSMVSKWLPTLVTTSNFPIPLMLHQGHPDQTFQGFMTIGIQMNRLFIPPWEDKNMVGDWFDGDRDVLLGFW